MNQLQQSAKRNVKPAPLNKEERAAIRQNKNELSIAEQQQKIKMQQQQQKREDRLRRIREEIDKQASCSDGRKRARAKELAEAEDLVRRGIAKGENFIADMLERHSRQEEEEEKQKMLLREKCNQLY